MTRYYLNVHFQGQRVNTAKFTKQRKMRQAGIVACMGKSEILRSPQGMRQLRKSRGKLEGNKNKIILKN